MFGEIRDPEPGLALIFPEILAVHKDGAGIRLLHP